jgi:hypothetical protein
MNKVARIAPADRGRAAHRALVGAAAKVRITPAQRRAIVASAKRKAR